MTSFQPTLPKLHVAVRRPLIGMNGACALLAMASEEVDALVELGFLVAFNIAVRKHEGDGSKADPQSRTQWRLLVDSISHFQRTGSQSFTLKWPQLFALIIPHEKPVIYGTEIDAALVCDPDHRLNLIEAGLLMQQPGTSYRPGRNGAPAITRASFEQFLKARQL